MKGNNFYFSHSMVSQGLYRIECEVSFDWYSKTFEFITGRQDWLRELESADYNQDVYIEHFYSHFEEEVNDYLAYQQEEKGIEMLEHIRQGDYELY